MYLKHQALTSTQSFTVGDDGTADTAELSGATSTLNDVNSIDISTSQTSAQEAIDVIDSAIAQIDSQRASLGAVQNRLVTQSATLQTSLKRIFT